MVVGGRPTALYSSENTTVNGVKAKIAYMPPDKSGWHIHIADSQNNIYSLVAEGPIADKTIFDEILSTFKFIESNDSVPAVQSDSDQESGLQDDICTVLANEPDSQLSAIKLPGNCGQNLDIGKDIKNWKYIPVFHEWDTEDTYTGPALALWDENGKFVQKITETFKQGSGSQAGGGSFDNDINFDGYKDLQVEICPGPVDIELATFDYWIFDPISKKFKKDPVLNNITNAEFDKDKKMITSGAGVLNACFGDPKCGPGWETTYKFNSSSGVYQELYRPDNLPKFEDFPAKEIYTGKPAEVNFQDHPLAKKFDETGGPGGAYQGLLTREAAKGPNFDGDYRLIKWSCGSSCVAVAIIDIPVGDIVYSSFTDENNWPDFSPWEGLGYRVDSSLLVVSGRYYDWSPFPSSILSIGFKL